MYFGNILSYTKCLSRLGYFLFKLKIWIYVWLDQYPEMYLLFSELVDDARASLSLQCNITFYKIILKIKKVIANDV